MITTILTLINLYIDHKQELNKINKSISSIESSSIPTITLALWRYDHVQIKSILNGLEKIPFVKKIIILEAEKKVFAKTLQETEKDRFLKQMNYPLIRKTKNSSQQIGELQLFISNKDAYLAPAKRLGVYFFSQGIKTLLISFFILLIFYQTIGRKLNTITLHLTQMQLDKLTPLDKSLWDNEKQESEIAILGTSINKFISEIITGKNIDLAKLQQSEQRLILAQKIAKIGSWSYNPKTQEVFWSDQMFKIFRHSAQNGAPSFEQHLLSIDPEYRSSWDKSFNHCIDTGESIQLVTKVMHPINNIWIEGTAKAKLDAKGNVCEVFGTCQDITNRVELEQQIAKKNEIENTANKIRKDFFKYKTEPQKLFDLILENFLLYTNSSFGLIGDILHDEDNNPSIKPYSLIDLTWDKQTKSLYQHPREDAFEFSILNNIFGEVVRTKEIKITHDFSNEKSSNETPKVHPPLDTFAGIPIIIDDKMTSIIAVANAKHYTQDLIESLSPLFIATADIVSLFKYEAEVQKSKEISLHSAKLASIGELAAGVGHEINNPLAIADGNINMIYKKLTQMSLLTTELDSFFLKYQAASKRISSIVNGLRIFARNNEVELCTINVTSKIIETVELIKIIYEKQAVSINLDLCQEDIFIRASEGQLQQVLMNLISNAKDAMNDKSKKEILISTLKINGMIQINITDTGTGISSQNIKKIFAPFFTTKGVGVGTGMGLGITNSLTQQMNGKITVKSKLGIGTTFTVTIPSEETKMHEDKDKKPLETTTVASLSGNILIVDDEEDLREILEFELSDLGLTIDEAENGVEALKKLNQKEYDLVITDFQMPKMGGLELIKQSKETLTVMPKFVICSGGVGSLSDADEVFLTEHSSGVIEKPFNFEKIQKLLASLL
jgi:signal transduction histidine kinase/CheY-like chemotaxis protein/PAS domain-containing protein